ncbi:glycosyltransferase family 4 protein [Winogradskyella rapida]|uniref:Glycosyltransferase family 4 protein n=1 Tax=Winogradskyella rapida TaxID=549701 RepID=A0ABW3KMC3_9FLAO
MNNSTSDYFITLSNKLAETNTVVVITSKVRKTQIVLNEDVVLLKWPSKRPTKWRDFWFLYGLVRKYKPELMISMFSSVNLFLIVGWIHRVEKRVSWIRTLSTQYSQNNFKVYRKSFIYGLATDIITNSLATKDDASTFFSIPETKITVLPNSVKDYSVVLDGINTCKNKLLYVGRLHPSKGVDILLHAFAQIAKEFPNVTLDIIGNGYILNDLKSLTIALEVSDKVTFLGEKNKEVVLRAYKQSYCTIVPSNSEAFGFTLIEAMSSGTCVIGANNTGIKEIIINGESGLLFETGNSVDLKTKLKQILLDENLRNDLAKSGYIRFLKYYENSIAINRDVDFFKNLS